MGAEEGKTVRVTVEQMASSVQPFEPKRRKSGERGKKEKASRGGVSKANRRGKAVRARKT